MTALPAVSRSNRRVVALGGGHGLAATLTALRAVADQLTAIVTVADDGGSSGRLRRDYPELLPPGDLRMALVALASDDADGRLWSDVLQHRFTGSGDLAGHAVGNLLMTGLLGVLGDPVRALDELGRLVGSCGRVLPMSMTPLEIVAEVSDPAAGGLRTVRGQGRVAVSTGVVGVAIEPADPPACSDALTAVHAADLVVLGPGSWFTSVLPHLLVPELAAALRATSARRVLVLNLAAEAAGETADLSLLEHLEVFGRYAPGLRIDVVLANESTAGDRAGLVRGARTLGAELVLAPVAVDDGSPRHDPVRLADAFREVLARPHDPLDLSSTSGNSTGTHTSSSGGHRAWQ